MFTDTAFPPDIRIEKETKAVLSFGYDVCVVTPKSDLNALKRLDKRIKIIHNRVYSFRGITFMNPLEIIRILHKVKPDIVHVHDVKVAPYVILASKVLRIPVIVDNHEIWYYLASTVNANSLIKSIYVLYFYVMEFFSLKFANFIITINDLVKQELSRLFKIDKNKIAVISNFSSQEEFENIKETNDPRLLNKFVVVYVGGLERLRGIDDLILAAKYLRDLQDLLIVIIGKPTTNTQYEFKRLYNLISENNLENLVYITGWLPFKKAMEYVKKANVGIVTYKEYVFTKFALPHKITQYLALGKPIIMTKLLPAIKLFKDACLTVKSNPKSIANAIRLLYLNRDLYENKKISTKKLFLEYNWDVEKNKLKHIYEKILNR